VKWGINDVAQFTTDVSHSVVSVYVCHKMAMRPLAKLS